MKLLAYSSAKLCEWVVLNNEGEIILETTTKTINPTFQTGTQIQDILVQSKELKNQKNIDKVRFYGTGCDNADSIDTVYAVFKKFFSQANIIIKDDLDAAVNNAVAPKGVICMLGTGSKSCYYDSSNISRRIANLDYLVMDDGSASYYGKELLRVYFYNKMPKDLEMLFASSFDLDEKKILRSLYETENPQHYLATFAGFLITNKQHPLFQNIINKGINLVFESLLQPYHEELLKFPLKFMGSISLLLKNELTLEAQKRGYKAISFATQPVEKLSQILYVD
ncbi:MAG: hypothetical protein V7767_01625 [Leeuwenhoekiella sp.]